MKENKTHEKLFELISSKNFESLRSDEKKLVLTEMEPDEYNRLNELENKLHAIEQENTLSSSESLKRNLLSAFDNHHSEQKNRKGLLRFLLIKVPMYQSIAAVFVSCIFFTVLYFLNDFNSTKPEYIVYKFKTDTVNVQSTVAPVVDSVKKQEPIIPENKSVTAKQLKSKQPEIDKEFLCRSIKSDSDLKQFMVSL